MYAISERSGRHPAGIRFSLPRQHRLNVNSGSLRDDGKQTCR
jgi:hypothetical protein